MNASVIRTAVISSVATAVLVTAIGVYAGPRLMNPQSPTDSLMQPAVSTSAVPVSDTTVQPQLTRRVYARPTVVRTAPAVYRDSSGEPAR